MDRRLLYVVNDAAFFCSHRLPIAVAAKQAGYEVAVACPRHAAVDWLEENGLRHFDLPLSRKQVKFLGELKALRELDRIFVRFKPDLAHLITSKPIILGGIVSRLRRVPTVAAVSGLGHVFIDQGLKARLLRRAAMLGYKASMARRGLFPIFQNMDNIILFKSFGALSEEPTLIRGSGTSLDKYDPTPADNEVVQVVLPARMLYTKGVVEFVKAAALLKSEGVAAEFALVGNPDPGNPASLSEGQLRKWAEERVVRWEPYRQDIEKVLSQSDIVVLPSHNEGFPKTLVDAAAAGRAVVTNDVTGCRDAVIAGETALLANPLDIADLAEKMRVLIEDRDKRLSMGRAGRALAEREFAIEKIIEQHLFLYKKALSL